VKFDATPIDGLYLVERQPIIDARGSFARSMCKKEFAAIGFHGEFVQRNVSRCEKAGTLRGLHYQERAHAETKFLDCTRGSIFNVAVDLREESDSYLCWYGIELTARNNLSILVPKGCAHGYLSLEDGSEVAYSVDEYYEPGVEGGMRYDDPAVGIAWPMEVSVVSEKDLAWPAFREARI
jgi:dTDP-4-dehydrorhamnose 3,5-epimerase